MTEDGLIRSISNARGYSTTIPKIAECVDIPVDEFYDQLDSFMANETDEIYCIRKENSILINVNGIEKEFGLDDFISIEYFIREVLYDEANFTMENLLTIFNLMIDKSVFMANIYYFAISDGYYIINARTGASAKFYEADIDNDFKISHIAGSSDHKIFAINLKLLFSKGQ